MRITYLGFVVRLFCLLWRERFDIVQTSAAKAGPVGGWLPVWPGVGRASLLRIHASTASSSAHTAGMAHEPLAHGYGYNRFRDGSPCVVIGGIVPAYRIRTIQNGINLQEDSPTSQMAAGALGLNESAPVVGTVDPASARTMGEAGRRRAHEHFSIERAIIQLSDLCQEIYQTKQPEAVCTVERGGHQASGSRGLGR